MEFLYYLIQVNLYLILFYSFYRLVLFGETFHHLNRAYLVLSALLSFGIPLWYSEYVQSWFITQEINEVLYTIYDPSMILIRPTNGVSFTWADMLEGLYIIGISIFSIRLIVTLLQLIVVLKNKDFEKFTAFSFFGYSFVDETLKKRDTILAHEHVHIQQLHSADVMIFEVIAILNWFNPVVYQYKKDIKHIHEFIADEIAAQNEKSKVDYAMLLFTQEFGLQPDQLTNRFFTHSTLKRRIQMLSKPRSAKIMLLKYCLSVPLFILMLVFSSASIARNTVLDLVEVELSDLTNNRVAFTPGIDTITLNEIKEKELRKGIYIHGRVSGIDGKPLPNAVVEVLSKNMVSTTDTKGEYEINATVGDKLSFSAENFETVVITLGNERVINITLKRIPGLNISAKSEKMEELTIIGRNDNANGLENDEIFTVVEENPMFPGGLKEMFAFISKNLKYPVEAQQANVSGKVFAKFVVRQDGSISDIKILKGIGFGCDEETVRVIAQMPKWKPGKQNGQPLNVHFTMPVNFMMEEKELTEIRPIPVSGAANAGKTNIRFRGMNDPLVIVDGKEMEMASIREMQTEDIEKIDVIKNETATKLYGVKAINGVVIITTGKNLKEEPKLNLMIKD